MCTAMPWTSPSATSTLTGVQAGADGEAEVLHRARGRTHSDRTRRAVEGRERAVAGELDDGATRPATCRSTTRLWAASAVVQASSPSCAARWVDPTMSVNSTVDSTRLVGAALRWPVRNDSISSSTRSASPANHRLSSPSSSTSRACWIRSARYRACSPRTWRSPRRCSSSVGAWMLSSAGRVGVQEQVEDRLEIPGAAGEAFTARPPAPFGGVARPARRQLVDDRTGPDGLLENVDVLRQGRLGHPEGLVGPAGVTRERATEHE